METTSIEAVAEEREEGEIVDDLEDVSDCSMSPGSPLYSGKSVSPPELLSAVCLSSVSSSEYSAGEGRCCIRDVSLSHHRERHRLKRKRKPEGHSLKHKRCRNSKHHRKPVEDSNIGSASDNEVVDPKYAKKLRAALRRESSQQDLLHNSLRTRLKAFIEPSSHSEDESSLNTLRDLALLSTFKNTKNATKPEVDIESEDPQSMDESKKEQDQKDLIQNLSKSGELTSIDEPTKESEEDELKLKLLDDAESAESDDQIFENADDSELRELRIAALKSFVMENHKRRRRKAAGENHDRINSGNSNKNAASDIDKENDKSIINNDVDGISNKTFIGGSEKSGESNSEVVMKQQTDQMPIKMGNVNTDDGNCTDFIESLEDDVDILRTMLLASMSKRLASQTAETNSASRALGGPRRLSELRKVEKSKENCNSLSVTITKPLFRTIKNDLYTITNTNSINHIKNNKIGEQPHLPTNVVVKPLIINVNADSDSDTENSANVNETNKALKATVTEFLKKQRAEVEATVKKKTSKSPESTVGSKSDDSLMEISAVKLLPKSQQIEYRKLKQQLMQVHRKMRARKSSQRLSESKRETTTNTKKIPKLKTDVTTNTCGTVSGRIIKSAQERSVEPTYVQKALNALQVRKNGRLQMKGKYRSLAPLLHRINQASNERRQHEVEIKKLLQQIQKARTKLAASHDNFTALVQQLLNEKNVIDQCALKGGKFAPFTSTPNKLVNKVQCDISLVKQNNSVVENNSKISNDQPPEQKIQNVTNKSEKSESTNQNNSQILHTEEKLLDPNDITKVFVEQPMVDSVTFLKYTSPLDNRDGINDPLTTVCPYDLLGVCKDKECRYMHCS